MDIAFIGPGYRKVRHLVANNYYVTAHYCCLMTISTYCKTTTDHTDIREKDFCEGSDVFF